MCVAGEREEGVVCLRPLEYRRSQSEKIFLSDVCAFTRAVEVFQIKNVTAKITVETSDATNENASGKGFPTF